ncbi:MAG TPA: hypothetical protein VNO79_10610 [Actinomycetota bacterium]|nr:hypothetical protein [Actinomycetota bacterium]
MRREYRVRYQRGGWLGERIYAERHHAESLAGVYARFTDSVPVYWVLIDQRVVGPWEPLGRW